MVPGHVRQEILNVVFVEFCTSCSGLLSLPLPRPPYIGTLVDIVVVMLGGWTMASDTSLVFDISCMV